MLTESEVKALTVDIPADIQKLQSEPPVRVQPVVRCGPWKCFHCGAVFTDAKEAATHFGTIREAQAVCTHSPDEIRHMEWCLRRYRDEDTELHRQIVHTQCEHTQALMRAEESGYAKGLRDGRALASNGAQRMKPVIEHYLKRAKFLRDQSEIERCEAALNPPNEKAQARPEQPKA